MSNTFNVYGQTTAYANATFQSNVTINSNLLVIQNSTLSNSTNIYGQLTVYSNSIFQSNVQMNSNLTVAQTCYFSNNTNIYGVLTTLSNVSLCNNAMSLCNMIVRAQFQASTTDSSNLPGYTWSNNSNTGFDNASNNTIGFVTGGSEWMRLQASGRLAIGTSNAREVVEIYKGNLLANNMAKLAKSVAALTSLGITINWENSITPSQKYFLLVETNQQVSSSNQVGTRVQRHLIRLFDAGDNTSPAIRFSSAATTFGTGTASGSLSITSTYVNGTSLTLNSSSTWVQTGDLSHTFSIEVIQMPVYSGIGFVWLT
jgi:hypothetical protein